MSSWNPISPRSWADALGLAYVPLFPANRSESPDEHAVLLDGARASFHIVASRDIDAVQSELNLHWSWSSNLLHSIGLDTRRGILFLRRWDAPDHVRRFKLPARRAGAEELIEVMRGATPPRAADVILHVLRAFRAIRAVIDDALVSLRLFNLCLTIAEAVERQSLDAREASAASTFRDLRDLADASGMGSELAATNTADLTDSVLNQKLGVLLDYFLIPEPQLQYQLSPSLLLRHASGQLYQEAHLVLEREQAQTILPGVIAPALGTLQRRDVRFTPTTLARSLVEQALSLTPGSGGNAVPIRILDPACGSGVFLLEAIRELVARRYEGPVHIDGIDISEISTSAATFCLHHAMREAEAADLTIVATVRTADALNGDWQMPDVVLMNPPFMTWEDMTPSEQEQVRETLGTNWRGRVDKAMAFVTKATQSVRHGGVVASVLSSPMLESSFGREWRAGLSVDASLRFVGRFSGFGYFRASLVEPAFLILQRHAGELSTEEDKGHVVVLLAQETSEDEALRALRLYRKNPDFAAGQNARFEIFETTSANFTPSSWMPRRRIDQELIEHAAALSMPRVDELFEVNQGAKTGADKIFILSQSELDRLPRAERRFFRPVASSSTIRGGRLIPERWIFFPYGPAGLLITSEAELQRQLPIYFEQYLASARARLQERAKVPAELWWKLTWEREWQRQPNPKIATATWGARGSFAYDAAGDFVVVQGLAWHWRGDSESVAGVDDTVEEQRPGFHDTELPWAYIALLNSRMFERLLSTVCPRVQGGQFDLSLRFVGQIMIPDLSDETRAPADIVSELARAGRAIHQGKPHAIDRIDELVARMYGVAAEAA